MRLSFSGLHLYRSIIVLSIQFDFFGTASILIGHLLVSLSLCFGTAPISIGHFPCQFEFLGPHLYRSIILLVSLSFWVWLFGTASISIGHFACQFEFQGRTYINRPLSCMFESESEPHLYRSVIHLVSLSFWVWLYGTAPISIDHHLVSLSLRFEGRTYIDRPYSYHFSC